MTGFKSIGIAAGLLEIAGRIGSMHAIAASNKNDYGPKMALDFLMKDLLKLRQELFDTSDEIVNEPDCAGRRITPEWRDRMREINKTARAAMK